LSRKAREHLGSAGLGGNGQFIRLSALASLGDEPWTDSLTEDLDLGLRLMLDGWANHYNPDTYVSQQGVSGVKALISQRSRWFQGRLSTWRQLPALIASRKAGAMARMDAICYLLAPGLVFVFLPVSALLLVGTAYLAASSAFAAPWQYLPLIVLWYLFTFSALPAVVWAVHSEEKKIGLGRAFLWAHTVVFFDVIWFLAGCKAIWGMATGKGSTAAMVRKEQSPS
jgi:cellulose synthase/poly-beta-1,6-N-acetylglucosamine synthase-like glycosyltransferase